MHDTELIARASSLLPHASWEKAQVERGQFHDVVLLPGVAAVRVARSAPAAKAMARRTQLLAQLAEAELPFQVPRPLSDVVAGAVAVSWVEGAPADTATPSGLANLMTSLRQVDLGSIADVLGVPHEYAGGAEWAEVMEREVVARLPRRQRAEARRRIDAAHALSSVEPSLVHGDLAGTNLHWSDGRLVGVLDWDLAAPWDPAVDAACLAWFGWENVRGAVDDATFARATTWWLTFGLEQVAAAVLNGEPEPVVEDHVRRTTVWLDRTVDAPT